MDPSGFKLARDGGTQWTVRMEDFARGRGHPPRWKRSRHDTGHDAGYETQVWSPDSKGILYDGRGRRNAGWRKSGGVLLPDLTRQGRLPQATRSRICRLPPGVG